MRPDVLRFLPYALLAMGVACGISAGIAAAWVIAGGGAAPLLVVVAPPAIVAVAIPIVAVRRFGREQE